MAAFLGSNIKCAFNLGIAIRPILRIPLEELHYHGQHVMAVSQLSASYLNMAVMQTARTGMAKWLNSIIPGSINRPQGSGPAPTRERR